MAAHQAPPSLGFSRKEHWRGLPFPSPMHESEKWKWSRSVMSDSLQPHELQPTRLLRPWDFPGKSTGVGCYCLLPVDMSLGKLWELEMTEWLHFQFSLSWIGEGNGNPLQCSCLENPRDGGAWWAAIYGVAQSRTRLKRLSSSSSSSFKSLLDISNWMSHQNFKVIISKRVYFPTNPVLSPDFLRLIIQVWNFGAVIDSFLFCFPIIVSGMMY